MATVTKETIGTLHEKLTVTLAKPDYLPAFEKSLKDYGKKANIPGFRKGMVPAGLIKKMYGPSLFTDEVLRSVDRELIAYLQREHLDIFAQPLPLESDVRQLDVNNPLDYTFHFEIGLKPAITLPDLSKATITRFVVTVTEEMIENEITRLQNRYGNMKDCETVDSDENVLNVTFTETDAQGTVIDGALKKDNSLLLKYFSEPFRKGWKNLKAGDHRVATLQESFEEKERDWIISDLGLQENPDAPGTYFRIELTKVGLLEKRELNESFYEQLYPNQGVGTENEFRAKIREEIRNYWSGQAMNQIHDQVYHELVDHTAVTFPEAFLKKWMMTQGETPKTEEEVAQEFPKFLNQLKWTLISDKIVQDHAIQVGPEEIRAFARQQLFSYMGNSGLSEDQPWVMDYVEKMMKDRKYVEETFNRIQTQKLFEWAAGQVNPVDQEISAEAFTKRMEAHQHHQH